MNEYALKCLESVIKTIRAATVPHANENRRAEMLTMISTYVDTLTKRTEMPIDHILWLANTLHYVYAIGKLDGIREMMQEGKVNT